MDSEAVFLCLFQTCNECLHSVGAVLLHLVGNVSVDIQRESRGSVSKVSLYGLYIVPVLERGNGIAVSHIVKTCVRDSHIGGNLFAVRADRIL